MIGRGTAVLLGALALAGCAASGPSRTAAEEDALARMLVGAEQGPAQQCVRTNSDSLAMMGNVLVLRQGRRIWRNTQTNCVSSSIDPLIVVEQFGSSLCQGDRIKLVDRGTSIPSASCVIGQWVPYTQPRRR